MAEALVSPSSGTIKRSAVALLFTVACMKRHFSGFSGSEHHARLPGRSYRASLRHAGGVSRVAWDPRPGGGGGPARSAARRKRSPRGGALQALADVADAVGHVAEALLLVADLALD